MQRSGQGELKLGLNKFWVFIAMTKVGERPREGDSRLLGFKSQFRWIPWTPLGPWTNPSLSLSCVITEGQGLPGTVPTPGVVVILGQAFCLFSVLTPTFYHQTHHEISNYKPLPNSHPFFPQLENSYTSCNAQVKSSPPSLCMTQI